MKRSGSVLLALWVFLILIVPTVVTAQPREELVTQAGRLAVGANVGLHAGTFDDTVFGLIFTGDYYLDDYLSVGPMLQFGIGEDLFQLGISGQVKYVFVNRRLPSLRPHLQGGLGFLLVDADRAVRGDDDDLGFLVPFGGGLEIVLGRNALIGSTLLLNFTSSEVGSPSRVFMSWIFGLRIRL